MDLHRKLLLLCARTVVLAEQREQIQTILKQPLDWQRLVSEGHLLGMAPLAWSNLKDQNIPEDPAQRLRAIYYNNLGRNLFFCEDLGRLSRLMKEEGIPMIPIKGVLLASKVYGNVGLRQVSDVDIVVPPQYVPRAVQALSRAGYTLVDPVPSNDLVNGRQRDLKLNRMNCEVPYTLELHWKLKDSFLRIPVPELWNHLAVEEWNGTTVTVLSPEMTLIHLVHHLICHSYPLKILVDVAETVRAYEATLNWDQVFDFLRRFRMVRSFTAALNSVHAVLGHPLPDQLMSLTLLPGRTVQRVVNRKDWYFDSYARTIQSQPYLNAAFSGLFADGSYADLLNAYANRLMLHVKNAIGLRKKTTESESTDLRTESTSGALPHR